MLPSGNKFLFNDFAGINITERELFGLLIRIICLPEQSLEGTAARTDGKVHGGTVAQGHRRDTDASVRRPYPRRYTEASERRPYPRQEIQRYW
jgi:hypothetical protein